MTGLMKDMAYMFKITKRLRIGVTRFTIPLSLADSATDSSVSGLKIYGGAANNFKYINCMVSFECAHEYAIELQKILDYRRHI